MISLHEPRPSVIKCPDENTRMTGVSRIAMNRIYDSFRAWLQPGGILNDLKFVC